MKERVNISKKDIEKVYTHLHIQKRQSDQKYKNQESFETIAATFKWPKMFYPSLHPSGNNISSSANSLIAEK